MIPIASHRFERELRFPPGCCSCRGPADERLELSFVNQEKSGSGAHVTLTETTARLGVPICANCKRRHELSTRIGNLEMAAGTVALVLAAVAGLGSGLRWSWIAGVGVGLVTFFVLCLLVALVEQRARKGRWGRAIGFDAAHLRRLDFPDPRRAAEILGWHYEAADRFWRLGKVRVPTRRIHADTWEIPIFGNRDYQREFDELNGIQNRLGLPYGAEIVNAVSEAAKRRKAELT